MAWVIKDSYPYQDTVDGLIEVPGEPYPYSVMIQRPNEYPKYADANLLDVPIEPYPYSIMVQRPNEYPKYNHLNLTETGAFCWATNLETVVIPKSVKYIGATAFRHTKLKEVTISRECEYFDTSFPEGCIVKFYDPANFKTADGAELWTKDNLVFNVKE